MGNLNGFLFYVDEPCQRPEPEDIVNRDLIAFIDSRRRGQGLSLSDLAERYNPRKPPKMRRAVESFLKTARIHPAYMVFLARELDFRLEEVADLILASPAYSNISFHGMGINSCYVGVHRPLTIGDCCVCIGKGG